MTKKDKPMVTQNPKVVSPSSEKFPSAAPVWRVGMVLLVCVALFAGCTPGDPKSVEALENIQHPDEAFRLNGLSTLSKMGDKAKPHADKVAALLKDTSKGVRASAISFMVAMKDNSPEIVQELSAMATGDENADTRASALSARGLKPALLLEVIGPSPTTITTSAPPDNASALTIPKTACHSRSPSPSARTR